MAKKKYIPICTGSNNSLGHVVAGVVIELDDKKAGPHIRCSDMPNGILIPDGQTLEEVNAVIVDDLKKLKGVKPKITAGEIDLSDGISPAEARLAGRVLSQRAKETKGRK